MSISRTILLELGLLGEYHGMYGNRRIAMGDAKALSLLLCYSTRYPMLLNDRWIAGRRYVRA